MDLVIERHASLSPCRKYRYLLQRTWAGFPESRDEVVFVMLNPSTADGHVDDPTVRRCMGFARRWNYTSVSVVNLFALRATDPKEVLKAGEAAVGPRNDEFIDASVKDARLVVAAWGAHGSFLGRDRTVLNILRQRREVHCLRLTKDGHPGHPLYVPADTKPALFSKRLPVFDYSI